VLRVFANDHDATVPLNHEALVATNLDRRRYFHSFSCCERRTARAATSTGR
jgi:hypothetical protein